jgi:hypothetical protein
VSKSQRARRHFGAKGPGPALVESSIWGSESPVDMDWKKSAEKWARGAS